jgi:hydroxymethylpyrimidine/phosphomethylpyrimidine kinase
MQTVLTIAGFDPSCGAGITADLMVFAAHGLYGTACITGLTVQSTLGVQSTHPVSAEITAATLDCLRNDLPPSGIKIGMVSNEDNSHVIIRYIEGLNAIDLGNRDTVIVLDPVVRSSSGRELTDPAALTLIRERLLPLVDWITPNTDELELLTGHLIRSRDDIPAACKALQTIVITGDKARPPGVLATGGHLDTPDDYLLLPTGEAHWLPGTRVETASTHGTGCALSSAFLSRLVLGDPPLAAAQAAKSYVAGALRTAVKIGSGNGPMNLLWPLKTPNG